MNFSYYLINSTNTVAGFMNSYLGDTSFSSHLVTETVDGQKKTNKKVFYKSYYF